jgi:hypothetical protein
MTDFSVITIKCLLQSRMPVGSVSVICRKNSIQILECFLFFSIAVQRESGTLMTCFILQYDRRNGDVYDVCVILMLTMYILFCLPGIMKENRLRMFQNRMVRRIFGPNGDEVVGSWGKLHNKELHNFYSSPNIRLIKSST